MRHFMQLNDFGIKVPGLERTDSYHPVYGTSDDPFRDTRRSLLKKRLRFSWRKLLDLPRTSGPRPEPIRPESVPAPLLSKEQAQPIGQSESGKTLVTIASPRAS